MLAAVVVTAGSGVSAAQAEAGQQAALATKPLVRYFDGLKHYVTSTGRPGPAYREESRVPILTTPVSGLTKVIYSCLAGDAERDQFLTGEADCENSVRPVKNNKLIQQEGYLYKRRQLAATQPLYRCYVPHTQSHFVSVRSDCEKTPTSNVISEGVLGYFSPVGR
ncbi:hypothetical protein [Nonomuraea guangzhouensis]|uniref:Subtilisin inhibitor domain-containing protein n=1 Tax=Nonomuraea guangzhouensis TaxID=1291555 RepID=A0ABW4GVU7_9ACTN|nr:hypothetical protein [Nonomuraea guangzhouensis]